MVDYLKSILPRLQLYSKQLNEEANFVDVPWAFRDGDGAVVTYLFRRNNELLVTKQGEVVTGRWEFIASLRSLLVEYDGRKRLYNQGYLDPEKAVLILRKDSTEELFVLGNKEVIADLDVAGYLEGRMNLLEGKNSLYQEGSWASNENGMKEYRIEGTKGGSSMSGTEIIILIFIILVALVAFGLIMI